MSVYSYEIGTSYAGRVNVETLGAVPNMAPKAAFFASSESLPTLDGGAATRGAPFATWDWNGFIYADMFNALRTICPAGSVSVYIRTLSADYSTYAYYTAKMVWPALDSYEQIPTAQGLAYRGFVLRFSNLVVYTPPS